MLKGKVNTHTHQPTVDWLSPDNENMGDGFRAISVDAETPETPPHLPHRHFVVIPLVAVALLLAHLANMLIAPRSSLLDDAVSYGTLSAEEDRIVSLDDGAVVRLSKGAVFSDIDSARLEQGSALVNARAPFAVQLGLLEAQGLLGSWHFSVQENGTVTVAALTSSAVLHDALGHVLLVPAGFQWHGDSLSKDSSTHVQLLPTDFLNQQTALTQALVTASSTGGTKMFANGFWLLPGARRRQQEALDAARKSNFAAELKNADEAEIPGVLVPVLRESDDQFLQLLGLAHPALEPSMNVRLSQAATVAWVEHAFLSDYGSLALSSSARARAQEVLLTILSDMDDTERSSFFSRLVINLSKTALRAAALELPERSRAVSDFVRELAQGRDDLLSTDAQNALAELSTLSRLAIVPEPSSSESSSIASTSSIALPTGSTADIVIAQAEAMLKTIGAMRTVETTVEAIAPNTSQISSIFVATPSGDKAMSFIYDTEKQELRSIMLDGKEQPFPMKLEAFNSWINGGR